VHHRHPSNFSTKQDSIQKAYSHLGFKRGSFPIAENQAYSELSLPMYPELTLKEVDYVSQKIKELI